MSDDAIPQLIVRDERSKRETVEFCMARGDRHRCMLVKGHDGPHEALAKAGHIRWNDTEPGTV